MSSRRGRIQPEGPEGRRGEPASAAAAADPGNAQPSMASPAPPDSGAAAAPGRETVLGNCVRCGSADRLKFCSRCQVVRYCSPDCQKADVRCRKINGRGGRGPGRLCE